MTLGEYLCAAREDRGFSQRDLAEKCGVSAAEVSRVESGKRQKPSPLILRAMAEALLVDYSVLMRLAGYVREEHEEAKTFEHVFRDERTGEIVDVVRGVQEMFTKDADWANVAYRVSHDLSDRDREILTSLARTYLEKHRQENPGN